MKLNVGGESKVWEQAPTGTHAAWCIASIDMGKHHSEKYGNDSDKIRIEWELSEERTSTGEVFMVKREYNNFVKLGGTSIFQKTLEAWRGAAFDKAGIEAFDTDNLVGVPCMLTLQANTAASGKVYTNVEAVTSCPKGLTMTAMVSEPLIFNLSNRDPAAWQRIPEWMKTIIESSINWQKKDLLTAAEAEAVEVSAQVIPF